MFDALVENEARQILFSMSYSIIHLVEEEEAQKENVWEANKNPSLNQDT